MTAEIVDFQKYREQKKRPARKSRRSPNSRRRSHGWTRARKLKEETGTNGPEEALSDDRLENDDGTRGGDPV